MKYRGRIRLTNELLHQVLQLPEDVEIVSAITHDPHRNIYEVSIRSEHEVKGLTFEVAEGAEAPTGTHTIEAGGMRDVRTSH